MKKLILLLALVFMICGCGSEEQGGSQSSHKNDKIDSYKIVAIDSCEYIVCYSIGGTQAMVWREPIFIHKGNCKYCAERRKKEQEELIRKLKEN